MLAHLKSMIFLHSLRKILHFSTVLDACEKYEVSSLEMIKNPENKQPFRGLCDIEENCCILISWEVVSRSCMLTMSIVYCLLQYGQHSFWGGDIFSILMHRMCSIFDIWTKNLTFTFILQFAADAAEYSSSAQYVWPLQKNVKLRLLRVKIIHFCTPISILEY